jgi:hypothetical protein
MDLGDGFADAKGHVDAAACAWAYGIGEETP